MPSRRAMTVLFVVAFLSAAGPAAGQTTMLSQDSVNVSPQPPVELSGGNVNVSNELPSTGTDPHLLFLAGVALTLLGVGLRLRTADADLY